MNKINPKLKTNLIELSKKINLDLLVLFGSRTNNSFNEKSDWDFAYYSKKELNYNNRKELLLNLITLLKIENIDLIDLKKSDNLV